MFLGFFLLRRLLPLLIVAWAIFAVIFFVMPPQDGRQKVDAVIVLSGDAQRVEPGVQYARDGLAKTLVLSDGSRSKSPLARRLCAHPRAQAFRVICFRPDPYSTRGEARFMAAEARRRGWHKVMVMTSTYHVFRSRMLFERCMGERTELLARGTGNGWVWLPVNAAKETAKLGLAMTLRKGC